ncbi:serine--tRNA synthetase-like protein Slimp [Euwallacea fornicatus]|uniref:serine--tRNA synthetase-like protein Slimp n=1 Tax=Euwallacea fornicatus TaxID=995702 RepID=UPI00338D90CA
MLRQVLALRIIINRQFSSALYVTGDKAHKQFAVLKPIIDFDDQLKSRKDCLIENIKARQLSIDLNKVEERWNYFKEIERKKEILEETKAEIGHNISKLMKLDNDPDLEKEIEKLKIHLRLVKDEVKNLRNLSYAVEEGAALQVLSLPNVLHPKTTQCELEVYRYLEKSDTRTENHVEIGNKKGYFKLINHMTCYLKSEAALFELAVQNYFSQELVNLNYTQFSNSDFVKSVVIEGCGSDPSACWDGLTLENIHCIQNEGSNKLHLVGASSLYSFMAYFTKHFVHITQLPVKAFCVGRKYRTVQSTSPKDLFNLSQSSEISLFNLLLDDDILENMVDEVATLYRQLGLHFRLVLMPANQLSKAESLRLSIQMFSNSSLSYVEVGFVSFYEDYLSKRLLLSCSQDRKGKFPNVVGGSLINAQRVIGCALENNVLKQKPLLNDFLSKYIC